MFASIATDPGTEERDNEDWTGATPEVVVLLDGLSSAVGAESGCSHGTPWYVSNLGKRLLAAADDHGRSLEVALAGAIGDVASLHPECDRLHPGTPSATVAVLRMRATGTLEYLVLADARVVIALVSGIDVITDERVDLIAGRERAAALREPIGSKAHSRAVANLIAKQKPLRNHPNGYWVAAGDPAVSEHAFTGSVPAGQVVDAALMSDGASRIVDTFERMNWADAMAVLRDAGPGELIRQVRAVEVTDPDGRRWPRYKTADDATIAYVNWT